MKYDGVVHLWARGSWVYIFKPFNILSFERKPMYSGYFITITLLGFTFFFRTKGAS